MNADVQIIFNICYTPRQVFRIPMVTAEALSTMEINTFSGQLDHRQYSISSSAYFPALLRRPKRAGERRDLVSTMF